MKFTDKYIANLKPEPKQYVRRESKGFAVRVLPTGQKTWLYIYTFDGKRRQMNLGSYPDKKLADARTDYSAAYAVLNDKQSPRDPQEERDQKHAAERQGREARRLEPTVSTLIDDFVTKWIKKSRTTRTAYNDERALKIDVLPFWGDLKVAEIRRRDAIVLIERVAERAPGQARYLYGLCRQMFSFAIRRDMTDVNPFSEMRYTIPELKETARERALSATEIKTVWNGITAGAGSEETKNILRLILVTGQRPSEVCGMRKSEIDGSWWTIPAERMKKGKAHRVFLTDLAKSFITEKDDDDLIFSAREDKPIHVGTLSFAVKRNKFYGVEHWTPHDLRRTCRTFLAEIGIPSEQAEAVIGHAIKGVEGTYNRHSYDLEKQKALEAWERKLNSIITGAESNVVSIHTARKAA